jgi:hypothetical protein
LSYVRMKSGKALAVINHRVGLAEKRMANL